MKYRAGNQILVAQSANYYQPESAFTHLLIHLFIHTFPKHMKGMTGQSDRKAEVWTEQPTGALCPEDDGIWGIFWYGEHLTE
jgi:hypothetical protein